MAEEDYENQYFTETSTKMRDLEEKQRILKDRILLIGQNLIEMKEEIHETFLDIKKNIEIMKNDIERLKSFFETASGEFSKFAKKEELEILSKQAKMFRPLELVTKEDLEKLKNN
jgi:zona occludens toxin (predicted ATPase)